MISARYTMPSEGNFKFGDQTFTANRIRLERFQRSHAAPYIDVVFDDPVDLSAGNDQAETVTVKVIVSCGEITLTAFKPTPNQFQSASATHSLLLCRPLPAPFVGVKKERLDASNSNQ